MLLPYLHSSTHNWFFFFGRMYTFNKTLYQYAYTRKVPKSYLNRTTKLRPRELPSVLWKTVSVNTETNVYKHIVIWTCTAGILNYTNSPYSLFFTTQTFNKIFYTISVYLHQETAKPGLFSVTDTCKQWQLTIIPTCRTHFLEIYEMWHIMMAGKRSRKCHTN